MFTHHVSADEPIPGVNKLVYNVGPFRKQGLYSGAEKFPGLKLVYAPDIDGVSILPLTPIIILCIVELRRGIRDNHMMAGCNPALHWACKLSAHMGIYTATILGPVIVIGVMLDFDRTFYQFKFLGVILPIVSAVLKSEWETSAYVAIPFFIIMIVGRLCPIFAFALGLARLTLQARLNAYCNLNKRKCPNLLVLDEPNFDSDFCCESESMEPYPYLSSYESGYYDFLNLIAHFLIFFSLVVLLEMRIPQYWYEQFTLFDYKPPQSTFYDPTIKKEKTYVRSAIRDRKFDDDLLLVNNVHKEYIHDVRKWAPHKGVRGVNLSVKKEECLAILGGHGAGKSSLLNMLAGNLVMTRGSAYVDGHHIRKNRMKYIHKISLSSSLGDMDGFMTGAQNLIFIAQMRGYEDRIAYKLAFTTLRYLGKNYPFFITTH
uniref:SFRICE_017273 n=1 Tax=Spodoptera frugiperda TaxID=7108 RepID=A0A2H1W0D2_SPOFR